MYLHTLFFYYLAGPQYTTQCVCYCSTLIMLSVSFSAWIPLTDLTQDSLMCWFLVFFLLLLFSSKLLFYLFPKTVLKKTKAKHLIAINVPRLNFFCFVSFQRVNQTSSAVCTPSCHGINTIGEGLTIFHYESRNDKLSDYNYCFYDENVMFCPKIHKLN